MGLFGFQRRVWMAAERLAIWDRLNKTPEGSPQLHSGVSANVDLPDGSVFVPTDMTATENVEVRRGGTYRPLAFLVDLASNAASFGASLIGIQDAGGLITATDVEGALAELASVASDPLILTPGAEVANVIPITIARGTPLGQYVVRVYDQNMLLALVAAFRCAETGAGTEVSVTAKPSLLFTVSAGGAATISVTDVVGASGATLIVEVAPASSSGGVQSGAGAWTSITFD